MRRSVLIVVTHLLGVGHLTRAAALGRGLVAAGHDVTLVTGGRRAPLVVLDGMRVVQLPAVHCRGVDFSTLLGDDGLPIGDDVRAARIEALLGALRVARPDVVLTETFPFGRRQLAGEFMALLEAATALPARPAVLASVRDILNPPSKPAKAVEALARLSRFYDGVLVHGDAAAATLDASWPVDPGLARRLCYTGYVAEPVGGEAGPLPVTTQEIFVSGGGSAASLPLYRAAIATALAWSGPEHWRLFVGHGVPEAEFADLVAAAGDRATVERARPDFTRLLPGAALSVSQAGYNTMIDIAIARVPAIVVPFEQGREAEQRLRAGCFADSGLVDLVPEADLSADTLAAAARRALARPRPDRCPLDLGGIAGSVRAIEQAADEATARRIASTALDNALNRAEAAGIRLDFWWRDDDAVAPGPALDRLLDLAARLGVAPGLAVIPGRVDAALARRLATEPGDVAVLVHGLEHRNNAPAGVKKQELGFLPLDGLARGLGEALAKLRALFGARALPVLVPPWNRVDPALPVLLPAVGFRGISVHGPRRRLRVPGLVTANSHVDPIDWHGGGGLVARSILLGDLARRVEAMVAGDEEREPLGLLTHHLVHDEWHWAWVEDFIRRLARSPAVRFVAPARIFAQDHSGDAASPRTPL